MKRFIGDKAFYKAVLVIFLPVILQNFVTTFVNLLDNMMVGQLGTMQFSGVSIVNNLITVYNLVLFGTMAAVGIFSAQYAGSGDHKGVRQCVHLKLFAGLLIFLIGLAVFKCFGTPLISLYLDESTNTAAEIAETLTSALQYLQIMLIGLCPFAFSQSMSSTLRENGDTFLPMIGSVSAVIVNFVFNYLLIFGHFGFPRLGVQGAAIATVLSRFVELGVLLTGTFARKAKYGFMNADVPFLYIPFELIRKVIVQGSPLVLNELLYSVITATVVQCYSTRGLTAVAAVNITQTITHLFTIAVYGMGQSISIMVGHALGAGDHETARAYDRQLIALSVTLCTILGVIMFMVSPAIPAIYNTSAEVKELACSLLRISACMLPVQAVYIGCYMTLRSGGKTVLTLAFDSGSLLLLSLPVAYCLSHFTALPIFFVYLFVTLCDVPKGILGLTLVAKGIWVNTIV